MQVDGGQESSLTWMCLRDIRRTERLVKLPTWQDALATYMYPAERYQLHLVLNIEDLLLVHGVAAIGRAVLLWRNDVRDVELIPGQMSGQDTASLNVAGGV